MSKEEIIEAVKAMTVVELSELVKAIEEEFGVSAVAAAAPAAAGAAAATAETPNSSQMVSTSSFSSRTVIVLTDSTMAVIFSEAMVVTSINFIVLSGAVCIQGALRRCAQPAKPKLRQQSRPACRRYPAGQQPDRQRYR